SVHFYSLTCNPLHGWSSLSFQQSTVEPQLIGDESWQQEVLSHCLTPPCPYGLGFFWMTEQPKGFIRRRLRQSRQGSRRLHLATGVECRRPCLLPQACARRAVSLMLRGGCRRPLLSVERSLDALGQFLGRPLTPKV